MDPITRELFDRLPREAQESILATLPLRSFNVAAGSAADKATEALVAAEVRRVAAAYGAAIAPTIAAPPPATPARPSTPQPWAPLPASYDRALAELVARMARAGSGEGAATAMRIGLAELWRRADVKATHATREELVAAVELRIYGGTRPRA